MSKRILDNFFIEKDFIKQMDCDEKNRIIFYCKEFDNYYCPRTCHYAFEKKKKEEN